MTALRALDGAAPPPGLAGDLRALATLPAPVRESLWDVLGPNLGAQITEEATAAVNAFCEARRLRATDLMAPVKACRYLIRQAARRNLKLDDFRDDLRSLCGDDAPFELNLVGWYERALPMLRQEFVSAALAAHGKLATGVDWRLDGILMSQDGENLGVPVAMLTFRYVEGDEKKRITLQFVPEVIRELHAICEKMLR
ncbi:MAG: hypothetical protein IPM54_36660 [Polyangiaceae bacterium]|nr:hypothetical protein [Polyangiaceae bacterium]